MKPKDQRHLVPPGRRRRLASINFAEIRNLLITSLIIGVVAFKLGRETEKRALLQPELIIAQDEQKPVFVEQPNAEALSVPPPPPSPQMVDPKNDFSKEHAEDEDASRELQSRMERGLPILAFEDPEMRRSAIRLAESAAEGATATNRADYTTLFEKLGLPEQSVARLQQHLKNIYRASCEYELWQQQVLGAKAEFDRDLKKSLTKEHYEEVQQFVKQKQTTGELQRIDNFLTSSSQTPIAGPDRQTLARIIEEQGAFSEELIHGPWDPLPRVSWGKEAVVARYEEWIEMIRNSSRKVLTAADVNQLSPENLHALQRFYEAKEADLLALRERAQNRPPDP